MSQGITESLGRKRALRAYEFVLKGSKNEWREKYKSYVEKLPMLIKTNGLASALAFIKSKDEKAWETIYKQIEEWCRESHLIERKLLEDVLKVNMATYIRITEEVVSLLEWMRRFVGGMIKKQV